jgi:sterol desaturase/sphingolipid hydroxylase (fatty acid hydroxylase superfamily)
MSRWLLSHEVSLRLASFAVVFAVMACWEWSAARRDLQQSRPRRWLANLSLSLLDAIVVRLVFPAAAVGLAVVAENERWGLLHRVEVPGAVAVVLSLILLDLAIYLQHVMFHAVPLLWRFHLVHHSDQDFDVTTGIRFHPVEILLSMVVKFGVIAALGLPVLGVFLFEVLLNATSMFNHGNVRLTQPLDRWLRCVLVTPDMHRVHHSVEVDESNSNFGFNLPWWDRLLGTYRAQPRAGHLAMSLGVEHLVLPEARGLLRLLALPFAAAAGPYAIVERWVGRADRGPAPIPDRLPEEEYPDARNRDDGRRRGAAQGSAEQVPRGRAQP